MLSDEWVVKAKCRSFDRELFFDKYEDDVEVRPIVDSICQRCPVSNICFANAFRRS